MRIECASFSKYRDGLRPGDDVPLILPGVILGVFDGATDAEGTMIDGVGAGRFAALTVAQAAARIAMTDAGRRMDAPALLGVLSGALAQVTAHLALRIPPSTTLAMAMDCGTDWRFVLLGDTAIRLNGREVLQKSKLIDDVSTHARVAVFAHIRQSEDDPDRAEMAARRAIFLGLDQAVDEGVLDADLARAIIADTIRTTGLADHAAIVADFLKGGIRTQHAHANTTGHPLCFGTMNGTTAGLDDVIDITRPKNSIHSIEIFSDGYPTLPESVSLTAWEAAFAAAEVLDFHKCGPLATVKGSTTTEFFDDRTVLIVTA
jgi:hypothetical protein